MTRSTKLKRRTPAPAPLVEELVEDNERSEEPPLKKFKALFDASDPGKMAVDPPSPRGIHDNAVGNPVGLTQGGESLTQSDSRALHSQMVAPRMLDAVAEEEEESTHSQARSAVPTLPRPRQTSPGRSTSKSKSKPAQSHQIDTDPAFLTALASRKGKKTAEDSFDREFNKLRISKPDIHREEEEQAWEILGDFDTEAQNLRGNFMVVIDLEIFRRNPGHGDTTAVMRTYDGRPNFKKFKKVCAVDVHCGHYLNIWLDTHSFVAYSYRTCG